MGIVVFVRIIDRSCYFIRGKKLSLRVYCLIVKIEDNGREEKIDSSEYLDIDPTIVRIVWVLMVLFAGFGILLYIILWLIMPKQQIG